jgi:hypothetical protein
MPTQAVDKMCDGQQELRKALPNVEFDQQVMNQVRMVKTLPVHFGSVVGWCWTLASKALLARPLHVRAHTARSCWPAEGDGARHRTMRFCCCSHQP